MKNPLYHQLLIPCSSLSECAIPPKKMNPVRKSLPHDTPLWINPTQEAFFVTINGKDRSLNQFANSVAWSQILESISYRETRGDWHWNLILAMPDHLHGIVYFPQRCEIRKMITEWKRWLATQCEFEWQDGFFEHRLRNEESAQEKTNYIRMNPVRAGFVENSDSWPYQRDWKNDSSR